MLNTLLRTTKLTAQAFQPKPKNTEILQDSDEFWRKRYKKFSASQVGKNKLYTELNQVFDLLIQTISPNSPEIILNTLKQLKMRCQDECFIVYIEEIKQKLEIITHYLFTSHNTDKEMITISLLSDANVCPEGCFIKLQQITYYLNNTTGLFNWLASLRLETVKAFFRKSAIQSVHRYNAILTYAQEIGLNVVDNDTTYHYLKNDPYMMPLSDSEQEEFKQFFYSQYTIQHITDNITLRLQAKINQRLHKFQSKTGDLVISIEVNTNIIEKKLKGLPIEEPGKLFDISEGDNGFYQLKSTRQLKNEVARYLANSDVFKKQTKTLSINKENWEFTTLEGDAYGDYGFILRNAGLFIEEKFPLSAFEEKELYQYFSLEQFHESKAFLTIGQNAFNYFYKKKANFSNCYLIDIDFQALNEKFISALYHANDDDARLIRAKLTYKQLMRFHKLKKVPILNNDYLVTMTNAQQFFKIITEIIGSNAKEQNLFLERHKTILTANKLYLEILPYLTDEKIKNENKLIGTIKKINTFDEYAVFLSPTETPLFVISIILIGLCEFYYLPLTYCGISLIFAAFLVPIIFILLEELQDNPDPFNYNEKLKIFRQEERDLLALEKKMIKFSHEQEKQEKIAAAVAENKENEATSDIIARPSVNPTSISTFLLKGQKEPSAGVANAEILRHELATPTMSSRSISYRARG